VPSPGPASRAGDPPRITPAPTRLPADRPSASAREFGPRRDPGSRGPAAGPRDPGPGLASDSAAPRQSPPILPLASFRAGGWTPRRRRIGPILPLASFRAGGWTPRRRRIGPILPLASFGPGAWTPRCGQSHPILPLASFCPDPARGHSADASGLTSPHLAIGFVRHRVIRAGRPRPYNYPKPHRVRSAAGAVGSQHRAGHQVGARQGRGNRLRAQGDPVGLGSSE